MMKESPLVDAAGFGVAGDGVTLNTRALQAAIDAAAAVGGTLVLPPGAYRTGSLFLKSGMALRIDRGVSLLGAQDIADYERRPTRIAGVEITWPSALINICGQSDVRLYGEGLIDGDGKVFWDSFWSQVDGYEARGLRWAADYDIQRPRLIQVFESERVEIGGGLNLHRSGFWAVQVVYSEQVKVSGLVIRNNIGGRGPSTDGVDIDSSRHVLVEDCDIDNNDDALCLKAGRDADGLRVNRPCEHVLIRNCVIRNSEAGVTFGSETSGGIRHVEVHGLKVIGPVRQGVLFKSAATRGGTLSDIHIHDIEVTDAQIGISVEFNWFPLYSYTAVPEGLTGYPAHWDVLTAKVAPEQGLPRARGVRIERMTVRRAEQAITLDAYAAAPLEDFSFEAVDIEAVTAGFVRNARQVRFTGCRIVAADGTAPELENAEVEGL